MGRTSAGLPTGPVLTHHPAGRPTESGSPSPQTGKKEAVPQLFLMPADGGEARWLTDGAGGRLVPRLWSPGGERIAFLRPDEESEDEARDKKDKRDELIVETSDSKS